MFIHALGVLSLDCRLMKRIRLVKENEIDPYAYADLLSSLNFV